MGDEISPTYVESAKKGKSVDEAELVKDEECLLVNVDGELGLDHSLTNIFSSAELTCLQREEALWW